MLSNTSRTLRFVLFAISVVVLALANVGADARRESSKNCVGTYLVEIAGTDPTQGIWTFFKDGNFQETDSAEDIYSFSHGQGTWKYANGVTKMSYLDFGIDGQALPTGIARFDANLTFANQCKNVSGVGTLSFFNIPAGGDPLDITTAYFSISEIPFTGRQLETLP